ncbi:hypothetical protein EUGRSUZ_I00119 [Eucalyptus grandis]|uniref:Uncharacterized protein n=2 Tax=Eucalyptus grandis TaxID=71139 RepID=A0ACC3JCV9_EUCGR|nr:hypothetical protein EUGRSUZ_I00119 [Eucalyptus grandis]
MGDVIGACSSTNASSSSPDSGLSWFDEIEILMKDGEDGGVVGGGIKADSSQEFCDRFLADVLIDSPCRWVRGDSRRVGDKEEPGSSDDGWNYSSLDSFEPAKIIAEKDQHAFDASMVSEIDRTMKKHADSLLHVLEGVSAGLTQLESRTRNLENSVDDLKVSVDNNYGTTDGKMRQLENILRDEGCRCLKDKQEIMESQYQLAKLQLSKSEQQQDNQKASHVDSQQPVPSIPQQSLQQTSHANFQQPLPALPTPNAPLPPPPHKVYRLHHHLRHHFRQPPAQPPSGPPPQQFYGATPQMYVPPPSRSSSGISASEMQYGGAPQYGSSSPMKSQQHSQSGGIGYPQLPTARVLPHALPTASAVSGNSGSSGTGNRVPVDDVVDNVTSMGLTRDQIRGTVRRLTENGQPVDLNIVLDKLMNDSDVQPPRTCSFGGSH